MTWDAAEIRALAGTVEGVAAEVTVAAGHVTRWETVDFRGRAADMLRRRIDEILADLLAARRSCDDAADTLRDHAATVSRRLADLAAITGGLR